MKLFSLCRCVFCTILKMIFFEIMIALSPIRKKNKYLNTDNEWKIATTNCKDEVYNS